jgi:hypothetical protein
MQAIEELLSQSGQHWMIIRKSEHHGSVAKAHAHRDQLGTETLVPVESRSYIKNNDTIVFDGEGVPEEIVKAVLAS